MGNWVLSIVGIVALSVLVDIIVPDGQICKYVKSVFAIMTISVIIAPIPAFISKIKDIEFETPSFGDIEVDETLSDKFHQEKIKNIEENLEIIFRRYNFRDVEVFIEDEREDNKIDKITIKYNGSAKEENIKQIIKNNILIKVEEVEIFGGSGKSRR